MLTTDLYFCDGEGDYYIFKDVEALGDCAVLALLCHENFRAPFCDAQELRRAVVSFAQGPGEAACSRVYSILRATNGVPFHRYLQQVLVPRFWVGTEFFVFVTLLYGVEVKVHFFGADKRPTVQSSRIFLERNFPGYVTYPNHNTVDVFFHQYGRRDNCVFATYNHFAMLLRCTGCPKNVTLLNDMVHQSSHAELPWWKKGPKEGDDHKTAPDKTTISKGKTSKSAKKRSVQSKVEQKSHRASITSSYLQQMSSSSKKSAELEAALKEAQRRTAELAEDHKVNVEELDLPVHWFKEHEMSKGASADATVVKVTQLTPKKCHRTWFQRSFIIFMFLHPCMGAKDVAYTCKVTGVKENTLLGWLVKPELVACWLTIVAAIKASDILGALSREYREIFENVVDGNSGVCLKKFTSKVKKNKGTQLRITFTGKEVRSFVSVDYLFYSFSASYKLFFITTQRMSTAQAKAKQDKGSIFLTKETSRRPGAGRPSKWPVLAEFIVTKVREEWEKGTPITSQELLILFQEYANGIEDTEAAKVFVNGKKNTVHQFVGHVLKANKYSIRKNSISQSVPLDWRNKAEENALRIRTLFKNEKVDVVINADETFVLFHMKDTRLIVPQGIKRVGTSTQVDNEKMGATVLISCEFRTSMILPPMVIFTGVYGAKLMQQWENFEDGEVLLFICLLVLFLCLTFMYFILFFHTAKVVFNESHWMTSQTSIIYLQYLNTLFPGKKIGLIWDKHSSHYCDEVLNFIRNNNKDPKNATIFSALVDEGLTPIIQVPDVAVNKTFKQKLKDRYYQHRLQLNVEQGVKVKVTREKVVDFILESIKDINQKSMKDFSIHDAFKFCGLNPWSTQNSLLAFKNHLDELENNNVLKSMILRNQKAVELN